MARLACTAWACTASSIVGCWCCPTECCSELGGDCVMKVARADESSAVGAEGAVRGRAL